VATIIYTVVIRPAMQKKKDPLAKPPGMTSLAQQRSVERQMQNLLVELSEMARQITAQLDTRSQKLQMLIEEADRKITELGQSVNNPPAPLAPEVRSFADIARNDVEAARKPEPMSSQHLQVYTLADQGRSAQEISRELNRPRGEVELILALRAHV
jgi:ATP/maltotriose-dependent transcriptional regulator MalT